MKDILNTLVESVNEVFRANAVKRDQWIEFMLREKVVPPIKGEITKGKIRWRGLALIYYPLEEPLCGNTFTAISTIGMEQRGLPLKYTEAEFEEWKTKNQGN